MISVIIPTCNQAEWLPQAIESVLAQHYRDYEIIVVDISGGSVDKTLEVLEPYRSKIQYMWQDGKGLAAARNTGIKSSRGEYLQFLDADDILLPDKFGIQMDRFKRRQDAGVIYCDTRYFIENDRENIYNRRYKHPSGKVFSELVKGNFIVVHAPLIRKKYAEIIGNFDTNLADSLADWDFWLRLAYAGYDFEYTDSILTLTRVHSGNMSRDDMRMNLSAIKVLRKALSYISPNEARHYQVYMTISRFLHFYGIECLNCGKLEEGRNSILEGLRYNEEPSGWKKGLVKLLLNCTSGRNILLSRIIDKLVMGFRGSSKNSQNISLQLFATNQSPAI